MNCNFKDLVMSPFEDDTLFVYVFSRPKGEANVGLTVKKPFNYGFALKQSTSL